jgi:tRNA threonylcarbamoyladenosine biosynthesis protein TsaE
MVPGMIQLSARAPTAAATLALAGRLARSFQGGEVVLLEGELAAGKTHFVKGLAVGLGLPEERVTSPTFTLVNEYHGGRLSLYHVDLYRLNRPGELDELGLHELLGGEGVSAVEWIDRFPQLTPPDHLLVRLAVDPAAGEVVAGEDFPRLLRLWAQGPRALRAARAAVAPDAWRCIDGP